MEALNISNEQTKDSSALQHIAIVRSVRGQGWVVEFDDIRCNAVRAHGCLLEPMIDDRVLVALSGRECWILSVLERTAQTCADRIALRRPTVIDCASGPLRLQARDGLELASDRHVAVETTRFQVRAQVADYLVQAASWVGRTLEQTFERIRSVSRKTESVCETYHQSARNSTRQIENNDRVSCDHIEYRARETFVIRGRHIVTRGRELAKVDAKQIQLG